MTSAAAATIASCRTMDETNGNGNGDAALSNSTTNSHNNTKHGHSHAPQDSRFSCNICLEAVLEPVVTQCGHLYCWPCLYQWLEPGMLPAERQALTGHMVFDAQLPPVEESRRVCPVCKASCSVPMLVPIYVRTANEESNVSTGNNDNDNHNHDNNNNDSEQDVDVNVDQEEQQSERGTPDRTIPEEITTALDNSNSPATTFRAANDPTVATGLRQRLRFRSRDSEIPYDTEIPARPRTASTASSSNNNNNNNNNTTTMWVTPLSPDRNNRASLSHGLALSLQQALRPAPTDPSQIPPLHRQQGTSSSSSSTGAMTLISGAGSRHQQELDPDATEFLSRILLILGSFVILCLLLF